MVWDHREWEWPPGGARHVGACPCHQGLVRLNGDHLPIARIEERDTQQVLAVLRAQAAIAPQRARDAEAKVQGVGRAMTAIAEAYPSIAAQPNFLALQRELSNTEARIAIARSYYNGIATAFNARLLVVPDRFLALAARLRPFDLFNATDLEREVPQVRFAGS